MRRGFATLHMLHAHKSGSSEDDQVHGVLVVGEPQQLDARIPAPTPLHTRRGRYRRRTPQGDPA